MSVNFAYLGEILTAHGIPPDDTDTRVTGEQKSIPTSWEWAPTTCQYVASMIRSWRTETELGAKGRHGWLLSCEVRLHAAHMCGCITEEDFARGRANLRARFEELRRPQHAEFWNSVQYGRETASCKTVEEALDGELGGHRHVATDDDLDFGPAPPKGTPRICRPDGSVDGEPLGALFDARPELAHIRQTARARMVSPPAVLMSVVFRVLAAVPPAVQIPPIVGGNASLNSCGALVGGSAGGKGAATMVARDSVLIDRGLLETEPLYSVELGTGQGLVKQYAYRPRGSDRCEMVRTSVIFLSSEISSIGAHARMQGSTTLATICMAWSGEELGWAYADPDKNVQVDPHSYRMCLIAGVQPLKAGILLDDADGGTPQRFVWAPAADPYAPSRENLPECPPPITWSLPRDLEGRTEVLLLDVCPEAVETIQDHRHMVLREEVGALDGHALQARLKFATGLALLNGHVGVRREDWDLAGMFMELSDATRARVQKQISAEGAKKTKSQGLAEGFKDVARAAVLRDAEDAAVERVAANLLRHLKDVPEGIAENPLGKKLRSTDRKLYFTDALTSLETAGLVRSEHVEHGEQGIKWIAI